MQVPEDYRKCVVFLAYVGPSGLKFAGTAFFIGIDPKEFNAQFVHLVTAKHVISQIGKYSADGYVYVRLNDRKGGFSFLTVPVSAWSDHPTDTTVDVAVLPWAPDETSIDYLHFPLDSILTPEIIKKQSVGIGDEVFMVGLFASHYGKQRNVPVVRIGNVACVPEEPVDSQMGPMEAYIIEARSIGGLSGSPVFVNLGGMRVVEGNNLIGGGPKLFLLGLVHGHWDVKEETSDAIVLDESSAREARVNMGMAIVVPSQKIVEVLMQEKLEAPRQAELERLRQASNSSKDS